MDTAIIVALITGVCAVIGQLIISKANAKDLYAKLDKQSEISDQKLDAKLEKYQAVTDTKIDELTREVRAHNNFAARIPVIEAENSRQNERLRALENRANTMPS